MDTQVATAITTAAGPRGVADLKRDLVEQLKGTSPQLILTFASANHSLASVTKELGIRFPNASVVGASVTGEFVEGSEAKDGISVFALAGDYRVHAGIGKGLKADPERAVAEALEKLPRKAQGFAHCTAIVLLDPLAGASEEATLIAGAMLGPDVRIVGAAAGDDLKMRETFVHCGNEIASDAVMVALIFSKSPLGVGIRHGHEPLSPPLRVTKAEGNIVHEVEGQPAWDVWVKHTKDAAKRMGFDPETILEGDEIHYLLRYEAGLAVGSEYKIRAPLSRNRDGSLNFACGIAQGSVVRITEAAMERQIESAREAARRARAQLLNRRVAGAIVFDCICRGVILGDLFKRALDEIGLELDGARFAGCESYGEIGLDGGDMSGFHNSTTVVLAFPAT